jgi:hypothetical protein
VISPEGMFLSVASEPLEKGWIIDGNIESSTKWPRPSNGW